MNPKGIFKKNNQPEPVAEHFFALEITDRAVKGAIWTVQEAKVEAISFSQSLPWETEDEFATAVNGVYSQAVEAADLSSSAEPERVIFGLPFDWVEGEKIIPTKLELLRVVCGRMKLKPVGFVVTVEALIKYLKAAEGTAPSVILVRVESKQIELVLVRAGKNIARPTVVRSKSLGEDIAEALARAIGDSEETLPARILLYDGDEDLEELAQEVTDFPWLEESFPFLHLPKVETMEADFDIRAVALAGGAEVASAGGNKVEISLPTNSSPETREGDEKKEEVKEEKAVGELEEVEREAELELPTPSEEAAFGFKTQKEDSPGISKPRFKLNREPVSEPASDLTDPSQPPVENKKKKINFSWAFLKKWSAKMAGLSGKLKPKKSLWLIGLVVLALVILGGGFAAWWFLPKVELVVRVKPHLVEKSFTITLDSTAAQVDEENLVLPASQVSVLLREDSSVATTGTKTVGDPAQGEVIIFNRTSTEKTIEGGVVLIGPDELNFTLDQEVIVAAQVEGDDYTLIPGQATVSVTAAQIGSESNLAAGTEFEVGKYSRTDVIARSQAAFAGGNSQEVRVVSQADLDDLKTDLLAVLEAQAEEELAANQQSGEVMIAESIESEVEEETYQPLLEEETEVVTGSLGVRFTALTYQIQAMDELIKEKIASSVPDGYRYQDDRKEIDFELEEVEGDRATFKVKIWANLLPIISEEQIREDLRGKGMMAASVYLSNLGNGVVGYSGPKYWPGFIPEGLRRFPQQSERILIEISTD